MVYITLRGMLTIRKHTPETSFHGAWPPGFLWPSGSLCVRCRHRVIPGSDPQRLEDWGPLLVLDESTGRRELNTEQLKANRGAEQR